MPVLPACRFEPLWVQFSALLPECPRFLPSHPLGCHRERIADRVVFEHVIAALVQGSGYERVASPGCSDATIRRRLKEWAAVGLSEQVHTLAPRAYDRMLGLEMDDLAVDGCIPRAPSGGEVAGRSPPPSSSSASSSGAPASAAAGPPGPPPDASSSGAFCRSLYVAGKQDWLANGLPVEGTASTEPRADDRADRDVPTCYLAEPVGAVRDRVRAAGTDVCVVVNEQRVVLGLLREPALAANRAAPVESVMEPGPSTFRPGVPVAALMTYFREHGLASGPITTSDGVLVGLLRRTSD